MAKFKALSYKRDLKNAQHFAFIQAFITAITAAGFTAAKILAKLQQLVQAFGVEDQYYMITRASEIVAQRERADQLRDRFYTRLHRLIQAWAGSGMEALDAAATALLRPFDLYKVKVNAQMDEETGQLENLITDLSTAEMQAHLTTINGTYLFQQMKQNHDQVKALRLEQGVEQSEKVVGALASARKQCDTLYDELTSLIEAFAIAADDAAPYEAFIRQWNGTVKLYQDMLDRKTSTGSSTGTDANGGTSTGTDNGGTSDGDGSSQTGDSGLPDDLGTDNSSGGSSSGSDGGSTGDNGDSGLPADLGNG